MTRPYSPNSPYSSTRTERTTDHADRPAANRDPYGGRPRYGQDYEDYDSYPGDQDYDAAGEYEDYDDYDAAPIDRRWMWIACVAGAILLVAVICTVVILGGGDSGSVSATVSPARPQTSQPATTTAAAPPAASTSPAAPAPSLPPETVTTVTPSPTASVPPAAEPAPPPAAAPAPAPDPRTVTYTVTGNRQLIDLVTVIYTDQRGALQTDLNVALPWTKSLVLDPGVQLTSVTATSMGGQLNCAITDAAGATIVAQNNNTIITTCTN